MHCIIILSEYASFESVMVPNRMLGILHLLVKIQNNWSQIIEDKKNCDEFWEHWSPAGHNLCLANCRAKPGSVWRMGQEGGGLTCGPSWRRHDDYQMRIRLEPPHLFLYPRSVIKGRRPSANQSRELWRLLTLNPVGSLETHQNSTKPVESHRPVHIKTQQNQFSPRDPSSSSSRIGWSWRPQHRPLCISPAPY